MCVDASGLSIDGYQILSFLVHRHVFTCVCVLLVFSVRFIYIYFNVTINCDRFDISMTTFLLLCVLFCWSEFCQACTTFCNVLSSVYNLRRNILQHLIGSSSTLVTEQSLLAEACICFYSVLAFPMCSRRIRPIDLYDIYIYIYVHNEGHIERPSPKCKKYIEVMQIKSTNLY